jgi:predicted PurR-regulated permease PerM
MNAPTMPPSQPIIAPGNRAPGSVPQGSAPEPAAAPAVIMIPASGSGVLTAGGLVLAVGGLYFGQDIFVPFALAVLLSFALAPLVLRLRRLRLPKIAAIVLAVSLAGAVIGGIAFVVAGQLVQLAGNLPSYQETISTKLQSLRSTAPGGGVVGQVTETIRELSQELSGPKPAAPGSPPPGSFGQPARTPIPVTIEPGSAQPVQIIQTILGPLIAPLATAGLVVVFVIFILIERDDLRDRFIKLVGSGDLQTSTEALNEAAARVSRYLLMQLVVNLTYGVPLGIGLYLIGVPNALLWGLLAALLRFVPYLGPFLAALFPIALAFAVDPGWSMLGWTVALFLGLELISNNVVEPWLYGASTGLSSLAIITAAIFWTSLWGPVGLLLSTPLTVCLVVIGRYVPQLDFLGTMLSSEPALAPEERFYQRLLAGNVEEAVEIAEGFVDEHGAPAFFDAIAIPALRQAENDRRRNASDTNYRRIVADGALAVLREVEDHVREGAEAELPAAVATETEPASEAPEHSPASGSGERSIVAQAAPASTPTLSRRILCVAGQTELDRVGAAMLAQLLRDQAPNLDVEVLPPSAVAPDALGRIDLVGVDVVFLSYFHPSPLVYARYVSRRLKRRAPALKVVVCAWNAPALTSDQSPASSMQALSADAAVPSISAAAAHLISR